MQQDLARLIERFTGTDGVHATAVPRLFLARSSCPTEPLHALQTAALCIVAQGRKQVMLGRDVFTYDPDQTLVASVDLPIVGQVVEATPETPYLSLRLDLDPVVLSSLVLECGAMPDSPPAPGPGLAISQAMPELLDAACRLLRLLEHPADIGMLAPLVEREILYRLLQSDQRARLQQVATADSALRRVGRAIAWIKQHYMQPFSIEVLATEARMSPSALHHHFKEVTAMSPLQYQKQLRLQEARRLILARAMDAATAGFNVGYESPSQFSREYSRLFGMPPVRDGARLRGMPGVAL
jgi:AraC-like DNA-binding protein